MPGPQDLPRILVGDDESQICRLVRDTLTPGGYLIDVTRNGRELLGKYGPGKYSLVILDTILQHTSGMEVVMKLRDRGDTVPIILLSVPSRDVDRVGPFAFTYRADVLEKPFGAADLRSAVGRALGKGHPD
jgi:DNA-binding response OmpR family regulator